jgi:small-conductance mechanosensitive channel
MFGWIEAFLLSVAIGLLLCGFRPQLRPYRSLFLGSGVLIVTAALFPRRGNVLGQYLFGESSGGLRLPSELLGTAWWILGAWLVKSLLDLVLRRTVFPNDNQPHARRLFADLGSGLIYVVAFVGIMDTVLREPISAVLATSGVFAIVLGLALQNTLADVFSGLAINMESPFGAGDWITVKDGVEGQVMEINWRATRIRTSSNDVAVIPNSVIAKSVVTKHHILNGYMCTLGLKVDQSVSPAQVIDTLTAAAVGSRGVVSGATPTAHAREFSDAMISYELTFVIEDFTQLPAARSGVLCRVTDALRSKGIKIGTAVLGAPILPPGK